MPATHFENLKVYQLAEELADEIWEIVIKWDQLARHTVGQQIVRSADGIGACIAEGSGRGTLRIIGDSSALLGDRCMKPSTGCDAHLKKTVEQNANGEVKNNCRQPNTST